MYSHIWKYTNHIQCILRSDIKMKTKQILVMEVCFSKDSLARDNMYIMGEWDGSFAKFTEKLVNVKPHQYGFIPQRITKKKMILDTVSCWKINTFQLRSFDFFKWLSTWIVFFRLWTFVNILSNLLRVWTNILQSTLFDIPVEQSLLKMLITWGGWSGLGPCQTSMIELFVKMQKIHCTCFCKNVSS